MELTSEASKTRSIKDIFVMVCKRHGGRVEDSTCIIPLKNLYYAVDELGKEVARERAYSGAAMLRFVGEEFGARRVRRIFVQLMPMGKMVRAFVRLSSRAQDTLYKRFTKKTDKAEGYYSINMENEFVLEAQDQTETTWDELGDAVYKLVGDLTIETSKVAGVEDEAWRWFKKKVEESPDWWELTRR